MTRATPALERTAAAPPARVPAGAAAAETDAGAVGDLRFRALLGDDEWANLPSAIRRRFTRRLAGGDTIVYSGQVLQTRWSRIGWWLAQAARLVGGPLPLSADVGVASVVTVTEDAGTGGQVWTRLYARRTGFPQIIHSCKRFAGPTGLEEYIGYRIGMALTVSVRDGTLVFASDSYFLQLFGRRLRLPRWLSPGTLTVAHAELGGGRFSYALDIRHRRFGTLIHQFACFQENGPWTPPSFCC